MSLLAKWAQSRALRVLVACECSGEVRRAFRRLGHEAWSCDLQPAEDGSKFHLQDNALDVARWTTGRTMIDERPYWDLMIAHPPCTHLSVSGARWFKDKRVEQAEALSFVRVLSEARIERIAIENPISILSSQWRKPDQIIQPWQFGHGETKATCLWLKGLPKLVPTKIVDGREARVFRMPPGPNRARDRSRTYTGIAEAMAAQWGLV